MTHEYVPVPSERLLALDPASFGFGYAVLEYAPLRLVAWGTTDCRRDDGSALAAVKELLVDYQPTALVMPDWRRVAHPFRKDALEEFIEAIAEVLSAPTPDVLICAPQDVRAHFEPLGARSKQEIAEFLADEFPELHAILPLPRENSDREHRAMTVFDALAMALASLETQTKDNEQPGNVVQ